MSHTPSPMPPWRVVVLEDDADTRSYFETCLGSHPRFDLVGSFETLASARNWFSLAAHVADVLLTDLALPDGHGLELIYRLRKLQPSCDTLVISVLGDEDTVLACVRRPTSCSPAAA